MNVRRKDGSTVPAEVESVLIDPSRADSPAFVISRDITERKRAEEVLRREERAARERREELAAILEQLPFAVGVLDMDGEVLLGNSELARFGLVRPPSLDAEIRDRWSAYDEEGRPLPPERWPAARALRGETVSPGVECVYRMPDGRDRFALVSAVPLRRGGEQVGVIFAIEDISRLKHVEGELRVAVDRLREADRRKDEFLAMLSHELRNPLAPIRNSTYVLRHAPRDSEQARRAQVVIERQTEHVARLVDDLLDVTRIARGKIELRRARVDLREVVRRTAEDFRALLDDQGVALTAALPAERVWVDGDETRIAQVIGNLLHNAAKFTRRGDAVAVTLAVDGGDAVLGVRDTGAGIDAALLPCVFEPFVQGDRTLARSEGGLGLGLALVKGVVEQHGGSVSAASAGKGQGAELVVRLPLASPPLASSQ
jgi:PAS domain S-box-containing protein